MNDSHLWNKFRIGDKVALEKIYFSHYEKLFRYGAKFSTDYQLIEDCIQDLFIYLMNNSAKLGSTNNIAFYLYKSLRRLITKKAKTHKFSISYELIKEELNNTKTSNSSSEGVYLPYSENTKILKLLDELPERQKEIIYLKYCNDLGNQEIAEILQIKNQTVRNLLYRGLKSLRGKIEESYNSKQNVHSRSLISTLSGIFL